MPAIQSLMLNWLEGYGLGLGMLILIGPVFFTLLYTTLQFGFRAGLALATGIALSDTLCVVLLVFFKIDTLIQSQVEKQEMRIAASLLLIGLGLWYTFKRATPEQAILIKTRQYFSFLLKGFTVNLINPFVFIAWISIVGHGSLKFSGNNLHLYLAGTLMGIFSTDILKVATAKKLKEFLRPDWLRRIYQGIGLILLLFGTAMLIWK